MSRIISLDRRVLILPFKNQLSIKLKELNQIKKI